MHECTLSKHNSNVYVYFELVNYTVENCQVAGNKIGFVSNKGHALAEVYVEFKKISICLQAMMTNIAREDLSTRTFL